MKSKKILYVTAILVVILASTFVCNAQESSGKRNQENFNEKNILFLRIDNHFEQRGENAKVYSNPEISLGYDRNIYGIGKNHFFIGLRTGLYWETALTARDYDHTYKHPFVGLYPSYVFAPAKKFKLQVSGVWDVIFETHDDLDDFWWWYFGVEPSVQFYPINNFYISIGATMGKFPWFEPPVSMIKAFFKTGYCF